MNLTILGIDADIVDDLPDVEPGAQVSILGDPDDVPTDNLLRATYAAAAVKAYAATNGLTHDETYTALKDLLGDLRHLTAALGLDFDNISGLASRVYEDEASGRSV